MERKYAIPLFFVILIGGWFLFTSPWFATLMATAGITVLVVTKVGTITVAWVIIATIIVLGWLGLAVAGFSIDPYLGYLVIRIGIEFLPQAVLFVWNLASGSGRSNRGG